MLPPQHEKWLKADPEGYGRIFHRQRVDAAGHPWSTSEYDLSLCNWCRHDARMVPYAAAELMIAHRKANVEDLDLNNAQKFIGTIGQAYHDWTEGEAEEEPQVGKGRRKSDRAIAYETVVTHYDFFEDQGAVYATDEDRPTVAVAVDSTDLHSAVTARVFNDTGRVVGADVAKAAVNVAVAVARAAGSIDRTPVSLRRGWLTADTMVLDLGRDDDLAAIVNPASRFTVAASPLPFRRTRSTLPLPEPVPCDVAATLAEFRHLCNIPPESWPLVLAWIVGSYFDHPRPPLFFIGQHDSGKSTVGRFLVRVLDPVVGGIQALGRDPVHLWVRAMVSAVIGIDNASGQSFTPDISDTIAVMTTGGGRTDRQLYSNFDAATVEAMRVFLVTAIEVGQLRGDLASRALIVELPPLQDDKRMTEDQLEAAFVALQPRLLGAILTLLAEVLRVRPTVQLARAPRMADWARTAEALNRVDRSISGLDPEADILKAYRETLRFQCGVALGGDHVGMAVVHFAQQHAADNGGLGWIGTTGELLRELTDDRHDLDGWPRTPEAFSGALRRIAPSLPAWGISWSPYVNEKTGKVARRSGTGQDLKLLAYHAVEDEEADHE